MIRHVAQNHGASGQDNDHDRQAGGFERGDRCGIFRRKGQVIAVAFHFGIRTLTHHHDTQVGAFALRSVGREVDLGRIAGHRFERVKDSGSARREVAATALPTDGPSPALHAEVVRTAARHVDPARQLLDWQERVVVLQQDHRLGHRLTGHFAVGLGAELRLQFFVRPKIRLRIHHAHGKFDPQNPGDRIIDPRHGNFSLLHQFLQHGDELLVAVGQHHHVHAGIDRNLDALLVIRAAHLPRRIVALRRGVIGLRTDQLIDGIVIGNEETLETQLVLQDVGQELLVAGAFDPVPTAVGRHDRGHTGLDRVRIRAQMNGPQSRLVDPHIALVKHALSPARFEFRSSVTDEMLGAGRD